MTPYTREELAEGLRALASLQQKSEAALQSMQKKGGRAAQLTLLRRRIQALQMGQALMRQQLEQQESADLQPPEDPVQNATN